MAEEKERPTRGRKKTTEATGKKAAPIEYRSIYRPISTNVPGMQLCELHTHLPKMADKFSLIANNAMHDKWLHANPVKITSPEQVLKILEAAA